MDFSSVVEIVISPQYSSYHGESILLTAFNWTGLPGAETKLWIIFKQEWTLIIGNSHINWLQQYLFRYNGAANPLNLNEYPLVYFRCISRGKVTNNAHVHHWEKAIERFQPQVLLVNFGGNDMDTPTFDSEVLALRIIALALKWKARYSNWSVITVQLIPKPQPRHISQETYKISVVESNNKSCP